MTTGSGFEISRLSVAQRPTQSKVGFLAALGMTYPFCHSEEQSDEESRSEMRSLAPLGMTRVRRDDEE
jgi:hypothetical protein